MVIDRDGEVIFGIPRLRLAPSSPPYVWRNLHLKLSTRKKSGPMLRATEL